jgi:hypothetical protein
MKPLLPQFNRQGTEQSNCTGRSGAVRANSGLFHCQEVPLPRPNEPVAVVAVLWVFGYEAGIVIGGGCRSLWWLPSPGNDLGIRLPLDAHASQDFYVSCPWQHGRSILARRLSRRRERATPGTRQRTPDSRSKQSPAQQVPVVQLPQENSGRQGNQRVVDAPGEPPVPIFPG